MDPITVRRAFIKWTDFASTALRYNTHLRIESSLILKTRISVLGLIYWLSSWSSAFILNLFIVRLKYISLYFSGQN